MEAEKKFSYPLRIAEEDNTIRFAPTHDPETSWKLGCEAKYIASVDELRKHINGEVLMRVKSYSGPGDSFTLVEVKENEYGLMLIGREKNGSDGNYNILVDDRMFRHTKDKLSTVSAVRARFKAVDTTTVRGVTLELLPYDEARLKASEVSQVVRRGSLRPPSGEVKTNAA